MTDDAGPTADAALESRLAAVERALTEGETDVDGLPDAAALAARADELESTVERLDDRVAELEAATRALRGYVGGVRAVDESVERRADAALAAVESLESELRDGDATLAAEAANAADAPPATARDGPSTSGDADGDARGVTESARTDGGDANASDGGDGSDASRAAALAARLRDAS